VEAMQDSIAQNGSDIDQNSTGIAENSTATGQNNSDIAQNSSDIDLMGTEIDRMGSDIAEMGNDIDQLGEQNESILEQIQMMSWTQCDQPILLEDFDSPVLHEKVKIKSVHVDLTNSSKVQLHLKLHKRDPFGPERDVYVHRCMQESLGVALSSARNLRGRTHTDVLVGLDSSGDAVLIQITIGKKLRDDDDDDS